jgi:molecular chaperone DnaK
LTDKHVELLATGGEAYLGGDDIDQQLAEWAAETILQTHRWDVRTSSSSFQALVFACERAKTRLSETHDTAVPLGQIDQVLKGKHILMERTQVDKLCALLVQRTFVLCDDVLGRARLRAHDVDAVILAGGGSHMPIVQRTVEQYFGKRPLMSLPPDEIVALGAAHFEP